jgi:hypothetical protein
MTNRTDQWQQVGNQWVGPNPFAQRTPPPSTPPSPGGNTYAPAGDGAIRAQSAPSFNPPPVPTYQQPQPFDGSFQSASGGGMNFGGYGANEDVLRQMAEQFGITNPQMTQQNGPNSFTSNMPATYPIQPSFTPQSFGFPGGPVEGGLQGFMQQQGMPSSPNLERLMNGQALQSSDISRSVGALGNIPIPSLQSLARLAPSELEFLSGLFETVLGIPFMDILWQAQRPYQGLRGAPQGQFSFLGQ